MFYPPSPPVYVPTPVDSTPVYVAPSPPPVVVVREQRDDGFANGLRTAAVVAVVVTSPLWVPPLLNAFEEAAAEVAAQKGQAGYGDGDNTRDGEETLEGDVINYEEELSQTRDLMDELEAELAASPDALVTAIERPADGTYMGESAEDDDADQAVATSLTFSRDGEILGSGYDGIDGAYEINEGRWSANPGVRVAWIESYQDPPFEREFEGAPFEVALRGQVRPDGTILALWASSRGVGGTVELQPPNKQ